MTVVGWILFLGGIVGFCGGVLGALGSGADSWYSTGVRRGIVVACWSGVVAVVGLVTLIAS